jgi:hypothetical protein
MNDAPSSPISLVVSPIGKMRLQKFGDGCSTCSSILRAPRSSRWAGSWTTPPSA